MALILPLNKINYKIEHLGAEKMVQCLGALAFLVEDPTSGTNVAVDNHL